MRPFMHLFLFIFAPGNALLKIGECGGKINGFWDTGGSIQYPSHPDQSTHNITCTWIIDSHVNQTVSIEVISLGNGSLGVRFGNEKEQSYTTDEPALFSGKGRTIVQWINVETSGALHLRWNTSDTSHDPGLIPYTHSDANPGSPSLSGSNGVTYTPDIPERTHTPITHTPRGESAQQRRSISDPADKSRPLFPQENTNNEQETTGKGISDLSVVGTNSYSHTHSRTGANFASNTHEPFIAWASNAIQSSPPLRTTPKQSSDVKTNTLSHLDTNAVTQRTESSQRMDAFTRTVSNTLRAKRGDPSLFATASFLSAFSHVRDTSLYNNNLKQKDFPTDRPDIEEGTTFLGNLERSHRNWESSVIPHDNRPVSSETDRTGLSMSTYPNVNITNPHTNINADLISTSATSVLSKFPLVNQSNPLVFTESNITKYTKSSNSTSGIIEPSMNVSTVSMTDNDTTNLSVTEGMPSKSSKASTIQISHTVPRDANKSTHQTNSASASISETKMNDFTSHHEEISISTAFTLTTSSDWIPASTPDGDTRIHISNVASTVRQNEERQRSEGSLITTPLSIHSSGSVSPPANPIMTSDLPVVNINTVRFESRTVLKELDIFTIPVQNTNTLTSSRQEMLSNTPQVHAYQTSQYSTPSPLENTQTNADFSVSTGNERPHSEATRGLSPFSNVPTETTENRESITTHITASPLMSSPDDITSTQISVFSTPLSMTTPKAAQPPSQTTNQAKRSAHGTSTESPAVQVHSHIPDSSTIIPPKHMTTGLHVTWTNNLKQGVTHPSQIQSTSSKSDIKRTHVRHFFIIEDQPAIIKENTFQVLLQITLEKDFDPGTRLLEIEPFLQRVSGYQSQHVTWHNGPVLQTVVRFQTLKALPWLGRAESLLQEVGLNPLPGTGLFVGGVRVKNMTVGLQTDVCDRLFECPSGFQCVSSKNNASCSSVCHFDYCKHQGICVHRPDQQPLCQCPVGEDYWFMGRRCDLRMTRPRLVGVCFGVLIAVAAVMALLSYLAVQRFKSMLMQAKVEQTRSSYRRFNHFDELSARFWGRSWPGSEDSLDNPVFTRSDEILHLRALDRTCCYHDDTLSVVSTYHGSGTHLNTIYPHSSQYGWDLSNCSLADGVVDSGKASDLSVCSWPIEPIQWTPFPLLQQLNKNTTTAKVSRPRSYCEGMELVDLEKSWTA